MRQKLFSDSSCRPRCAHLSLKYITRKDWVTVAVMLGLSCVQLEAARMLYTSEADVFVAVALRFWW